MPNLCCLECEVFYPTEEYDACPACEGQKTSEMCYGCFTRYETGTTCGTCGEPVKERE